MTILFKNILLKKITITSHMNDTYTEQHYTCIIFVFAQFFMS